MRGAFIAITLVSCTRADETTPVEPPAPAVRPAPPKPAAPDKAELEPFAAQLDDTTASAGCLLRVKRSSSGLASEQTIPLGQVTWTLSQNWEKRPMATATCVHPQCIWGSAESRTLDIPHQYSTHHQQLDNTYVLMPGSVTDPDAVIAAFVRIGQRCPKQ